jgi:hypothetical protein
MSPRPVERLEKTLARVAEERGVAQERLRRWVSFLALCGVLERAVSAGILDNYTRATTADEFHEQFEVAMGTKGPHLIEVQISPNIQPLIDLVRKPR